MPIEEVPFVWRNGKITPWAEATTHVMTHAIQYGTSVFEGIRSYKTDHRGVCIFRNRDHIERLRYSARVYDFDLNYSVEEIMQASRELVVKNELGNAYIRPVIFLGYGEMGPSSMEAKSDTAIIAFPFGAYLGEEGLKNGIDAQVSSWRRLAPGTVPPGVKAGGNYLSSRLITIEAKKNGFAEGIGLSHDGTLSEGAGENLFVIRKGTIYTPPASSSILSGITRDSAIKLANSLGFEVIEQSLPREILYDADEIFFTGTAAEITPVRSVDRKEVWDASFPITRQIQGKFFGLFSGKTEDEWGWLDPVA